MMERLRKIISWFGELCRETLSFFGKLCRKILLFFGKLWRGIKSGFRKLWHNKYVLGCMELSTPDEEIRRQYELQKKNDDWTLYEERAFIEQLFSTRFDYFLVATSFMAAAVVRPGKSSFGRGRSTAGHARFLGLFHLLTDPTAERSARLKIERPGITVAFSYHQSQSHVL